MEALKLEDGELVSCCAGEAVVSVDVEDEVSGGSGAGGGTLLGESVVEDAMSV